MEQEDFIECRKCGEPFDPRKKPKNCGGYITECYNCSRKSGDHQKKYLGRLGGPHKGAMIEIFRENLPTVRSILRRESVVGPTANLNLSSPVTECVNAEKESPFSEE